MVTVGERVDDGDGGGRGEPLDVGVLERADDERARVTADDARRILERLPPTELQVLGAQEGRRAAEVRDGRLEGNARPRRRLGEVAAHRLAGEHAAASERLRFELRGTSQE